MDLKNFTIQKIGYALTWSPVEEYDPNPSRKAQEAVEQFFDGNVLDNDPGEIIERDLAKYASVVNLDKGIWMASTYRATVKGYANGHVRALEVGLGVTYTKRTAMPVRLHFVSLNDYLVDRDFFARHNLPVPSREVIFRHACLGLYAAFSMYNLKNVYNVKK